jgi:O-antigen/teichoic acid export membrane protein
MPKMLRSSLLSMFGGVALAAGAFISNVIIARHFSVEQVGQINFYIWAISAVSILAVQGYGTTLARFIPELQAPSGEGINRLATVFIKRVGWVAIASAIGFAIVVVQQDVNRRDGQNFIIIASIGLILQSFTLLYQGYLQGSLQYERAAKQAIGSAVLQVSGVVIGGQLAGAPGALAGFCLVATVPTVGLFRVWTGGAGTGDKALMHRINRFSRQVWLAELIAVFVWARLEIFFLQYYSTLAEVAYFAVSISYSNLATLCIMFLTRPLLPYFSAANLEGEGPLQKAYASSFRIVAMVALPACFGLAAIAPSLLTIIYGTRFDAAVLPAIIVTAGSSLGVIAMTTGTLIYATERVLIFQAISIVGALAAVVAGFTVVPFFGATGAACSRAIVQGGIVLVAIVFLKRSTGIMTPLGASLRFACSAALSASIAYYVSQKIPGLPGLALGILGGVVTYALGLRIIGGLEAEDNAKLLRIEFLLPRMLVPSFRNVFQAVSPDATKPKS